VICKIAFFCLRENDFFVSALNLALFLLSFSFCSLVNGTLPLKILSAHTQDHPKPPVEQRVKVMDTLDKKMQTILERENLSADKRLKLYANRSLGI
jgi:hypothetical protein